MDGDRDRKRENVCVKHSILPLEIFLSLLSANVLFFINTFQRQGWNKQHYREMKDSRVEGTFISILQHMEYRMKEIVLLLKFILFIKIDKH